MGSAPQHVVVEGENTFSIDDVGGPDPKPEPVRGDSDGDDSHIDSIGVFVADFNRAMEGVLARNGRIYENAYVLFLRWEHDVFLEAGVNNGIQTEIDELERVLSDDYGFETDTFLIPSQRSHRKLQDRIIRLQAEHDSRDELLIVYYGGHGAIRGPEGKSIWLQGTGPSVDWHSIQHLLEYATPDVAIFLDCCFAASADKRSVDGTVEILAACCQQTTTVGISPFSFTNRLTEVLRDSKSYPLTIAMLHAKLVNFRGAQRIKKLLKTPIHSIMSDRERPSIRLCPVSPKATPTLALSGSDLSSDSSLPEYGPIIDLSNPPATRVLLKLCLKSPIQSISDWQGWLTTHMPTEVIDIKMIKLEGLWGSHSSLALFSIPISVWDLLPPTLAYQQVGLITTSNLVEAWPSFSGIQSNMHTTSQDHPQIFPTQISDLAVASEDLDSVPTTLARSTSSVVSEDSLQDRLSDFALTKGSSTPTTLALKPESKASKETPISLSYYDERYFVESTRLPAPQDRDRIPTRKGQAAMDMEEPTNMKPRGSRYSEGSMRLSAPRYKDSNLNAEEEEEPAGNMEEPMGNFMGRSRKA